MVKNNYDGYIKYKEENYIFNFENNILNLFPEKDKVKDPLSSQIDALLYNTETNITLEGKTNCNRQIIFLKLNFHLKNNGVLYSYVPAFIISKNNLSNIEIEDITTIKFEGEVINKFYNPNIIIDNKNSKNLIKNENMIVALKSQTEVTERIKCGNVSITISVAVNSGGNINSLGMVNSFIRVEFQKKIEIDEIVNWYNVIKNFFKFICFRNPIIFDNISLGKKDKSGSYDYVGILVVSDHFADEKIPINNNILYQEIKPYFLEIFKTVTLRKFYNLHFPNNQKEISYVEPAGFLAVASGFENVFHLYYPEFLSKKDKNYYETKKEVLDFLDLEVQNNKGTNSAKRKYFKRFKYNIEKMDGNLDEKIKFCFSEYDSILSKLNLKIKKSNGVADVKDNVIIEKYVNKRNKLAHGDIDNSFSKEDIVCHSIMKALIYLIVLKKANMKDDEIFHILRRLFF